MASHGIKKIEMVFLVDKKKDMTIEFKVSFLEEVVGINEIDFDLVPSTLIGASFAIFVLNI